MANLTIESAVRLGEQLVRDGLISTEQLAAALARQQETGQQVAYQWRQTELTDTQPENKSKHNPENVHPDCPSRACTGSRQTAQCNPATGASKSQCGNAPLSTDHGQQLRRKPVKHT